MAADLFPGSPETSQPGDGAAAVAPGGGLGEVKAGPSVAVVVVVVVIDGDDSSGGEFGNSNSGGSGGSL